MLKNRKAFNSPLKIATNLQIRGKKLEQKQVKKLVKKLAKARGRASKELEESKTLSKESKTH